MAIRQAISLRDTKVTSGIFVTAKSMALGLRIGHAKLVVAAIGYAAMQHERRPRVK